MKYSSNSILALTPQTEEGKLILTQSLFFQKMLGKRIFILNIIKSAIALPQFFQSKKAKDVHQAALKKLHNFVKDTIGK